MQTSLVCFIRLYQKTLHLKDDKCTGGKHSKIRVTGLADANMNGDILSMLSAGKSKNVKLLQKFQKITLLLPRPEKKLDGFNTFRKLGQRPWQST